MSANVGRSRRPWCYHKKGLSLDDNLGQCHVTEMEDPFQVQEQTEAEQTVSSSSSQNKEEEQLVNTLQMRFGRLLSCEEMADIHFIVGSGGQTGPGGRKLRIPAHKLVLAVGSPVFKAMFYESESSLRSREDAEEEEDIVLEDIEPIVFLEFLRFLYTDQIKVTKENAVAVLYAAKKYAIPCLERTSVRFLKYSICDKNCLLIWLSAKAFGEHEFETLALKVIERFAASVCLAPDFLRADLRSVCELLRNDLLRINEVDLFQAVTRWAKNECLRNGLCPTRVNIREVLSEAKDLIRYPLMSEEQIRRTVANEGVLEDDVLRSLLCSHRTWPRVAKASVHFCNTPRAFQRLQSTLLTVQRFLSFDNQLPNRFTNRSLFFTANKRIFVAGIGLYGPRKACTFYMQISFSLVRSDSSSKPTIMDRTERNVVLKCDGTEPIINVKLEEPFEIEPHVQYEIQAKITPTNKPTAVVRAKFNPHLFYSRPHEVNYYYGTGGQFAAKVKTKSNENVIFNFSWDNVFDDTISENSLIAAPSSAPPTPNPPPRPPPPKEYRRPSRIERIKRALSFSDKSHFEHKMEEKGMGSVTEGQIPVIMFYA